MRNMAPFANASANDSLPVGDMSVVVTSVKVVVGLLVSHLLQGVVTVSWLL